MQTGTAPFRDPMKRPAIACGSLIGLALVLAIFGRSDDYARSLPAKDAVAQTVELRFTDASDGSVIASDAANGARLAQIAPGEGGFVRVTLRSMAAERKQRGKGADAPFTLERTSGGDLVLSDPETGRIMVLNAFGPSNEGAFARLLDHEATQR